MSPTDVHEDLDALDLSEPETDPRTRHAERPSNSRAGHSRGETSEPFDKAAAREASLRHELDTVKNMNQVIEGVLESLERAKSNMGTVSRTVDSASTLLNTWTRILAQTEKNQRLILNPNWQGASQDIADIQQEEMQRRREAEMREREEQERREALARKAEEDRKKAEAAASRGTRRTEACNYNNCFNSRNKLSYSRDDWATKARQASTVAHQEIAQKWNFMQSSPFSPALGRGDYDDLEAGNGGRSTLGAFETSLPMRVDYEAMMAYLLVPPAGGLFLLIFEHKSDYVRFHAWQSSMLFSVILVAHILISWSSILSWLLFICDIGLIALLSLHAYQDVDSLEHYEVPFFGRLANSFIDDE
ncbi:hypothetical protein KEM55_001801 [Ascosphaera atra]|nr:hypothetical protein KEM55_001801 [Ascosphaera atra]